MTQEKTTVRPNPCRSCPYRKDVPSGVWSHHEYEKLRAYDGDFSEQNKALFMCHTSTEHLCAGWVGHVPTPTDLASVRLGVFFNKLDPSCVSYKTEVPLHASGKEAADFGQRDIEDPSDEAIDFVQKLSRLPRLK